MLTNPDSRPTIWYPPGAGGMWVNYLLWCINTKTILPGPFEHFEYVFLYRKDSRYHSLVQFKQHTDSVDADIVLGSNRAWMNFYLNVVKKKNMQDCPSAERYTQILMNRNIKFNLEWCDIWEHPKKFIDDLSQLSGYKLAYNLFAQQAIEQYRQSCVWINPSWYYTNRRILLPRHCRGASDQIKTSTFWPS